MEVVVRVSISAATNFSCRFGGTRFSELFPPLAEAVLTFECIGKAREMAMDLVSDLAEKISEMKKYGQDFLSMTAAPVRLRHQLVLLLLIGRADEDNAVRRQCGLMWKEGIQSGQKAKRDVMGVLLSTLKAMESSDNENKRKSAKRCLTEILENDETSEVAKKTTDSGEVNPVQQLRIVETPAGGTLMYENVLK